MKAIALSQFGGTEFFESNKISVAEPEADEIHIKIKAASFNRFSQCLAARFRPMPARRFYFCPVCCLIAAILST